MFKTVVLRRAGTSVSATLPKEMLDRLQLAAGDKVLATETERGILLAPLDPNDAAALKVAGNVAARYRGALRTLAE